MIGFEYFGDIIAKSENVECMFISFLDFQKIPLFEQESIRDFANQRSAIKFLGYQYSSKYGIDPSEYQGYYT